MPKGSVELKHGKWSVKGKLVGGEESSKEEGNGLSVYPSKRCRRGVVPEWLVFLTEVKRAIGLWVAVVPHKAVTEVSRIGNYRAGALLWCMDGRANPLMDRKVVGAVLFQGWLYVSIIVFLPEVFNFWFLKEQTTKCQRCWEACMRLLRLHVYLSFISTLEGLCRCFFGGLAG